MSSELRNAASFKVGDGGRRFIYMAGSRSSEKSNPKVPQFLTDLCLQTTVKTKERGSKWIGSETYLWKLFITALRKSLSYCRSSESISPTGQISFIFFSYLHFSFKIVLASYGEHQIYQDPWKILLAIEEIIDFTWNSLQCPVLLTEGKTQRCRDSCFLTAADFISQSWRHWPVVLMHLFTCPLNSFAIRMYRFKYIRKKVITTF